MTAESYTFGRTQATRILGALVLAVCGMCWGSVQFALGAEAGGFVGFPESGSGILLLRDGAVHLQINLAGWGPRWAWMGLHGQVKGTDTESLLTCASKVKGSGATATITTKELRRVAGEKRFSGCFTMDTAATKAVVGFAQDQVCVLGDVTITPKIRYGAIYVTAKEQDKTLATSHNLLIIAVARARNTGMRVVADCRLLNKGKAPILMEPVLAEITIKKPEAATVVVLDHSGARTDKTLPMENGKVLIDTGRDKTCYYLVHYGE